MWHKLYTYIERIATHNCIAISSPSSRRTRQPPKHLSSSVILDTTGSRQPVSNTASDEYYIHVPLSGMPFFAKFHPRIKTFIMAEAIQVSSLEHVTETIQ